MTNSSKMADCQPSESDIKIHNFSDKLLDTTVHFHVMKMEDSLYIWVGNDLKLSNLAVSMATKYSSTPCGTVLMSDSANDTPLSISQKLAKRTKKQVFVSCGLPSDSYLIPLVEKKLIEEMKSRPECF